MRMGSAGLVIVGLLVSACIPEEEYEERAQESIEPPLVVTIDELVADYDANEIRAGLLYEDRVLRITGVLHDFGEDLSGTKYLRLGDGWTGVRCMFSDAHVGALAGLEKGDSVTVIGIGDGSLMGSVVVRGCGLVAAVPGE